MAHPNEPDAVLDLALELAAKALRLMSDLHQEGLETRFKENLADPVTLADMRIESLVRERILARFPDHRMVGEEQGESGAGDKVWYLDPVDGTMNYARGLPFSCFTCAFAQGGKPKVGVVAHPTSGEVFYASAGEGAWLGQARLEMREVSEFAGSMVLLELEQNHRPWPGMLELMRFLSERKVSMRILGSSALALAQVAAGRADLFVSGNLQPYDKAGGLLLVKEAGGEVGGGMLEFGPALAGAAALVKEVRAFLSDF